MALGCQPKPPFGYVPLDIAPVRLRPCRGFSLEKLLPWSCTMSCVIPLPGESWGQWDTAYIGKFRVGSPISVRPYQPAKMPDSTKHQGLAHITGIPDAIDPAYFGERITGGYLDDGEPPAVVERVEWIVRSDNFSPEGNAAFLASRVITIDWATLKGVSWSLMLNRSAVDGDFT